MMDETQDTTVCACANAWSVYSSSISGLWIGKLRHSKTLVEKQELAPIALMPCKFEEELLANGSGSIGVEHLHPRSGTGSD